MTPAPINIKLRTQESHTIATREEERRKRVEPTGNEREE